MTSRHWGAGWGGVLGRGLGGGRLMLKHTLMLSFEVVPQRIFKVILQSIFLHYSSILHGTFDVILGIIPWYLSKVSMVKFECFIVYGLNQWYFISSVLPAGLGSSVIFLARSAKIWVWSSYDRIWFPGPYKQEIIIFIYMYYISCSMELATL
jgi:hypothetical protein